MGDRRLNRIRHAVSALGSSIWTAFAELASEPAVQNQVNFYKHHIGDYAKKTVHLSMLEHGAYLLLLHAYYGTEKPLPMDSLYRIARAHTGAERAAVDSVVAQFWKKTDAGLINGRAFAEIEHASELVVTAQENGRKGGRPKKTQWVSENNPVGYESETQRVLKTKAIQTPDSDSEDLRSSAVAPPNGQPPPDPRKALWDLGVSLLGADGRSVIGKAIKRVGEPRVGEILGQMAAKPPAEPRSWFIKATQGRGVVV